jgi:diacylglycerol kinase family enzyme
LVLAAGGDGTVGKVAHELIDSGIPLSVLPLGTANNLARTLGFIGSPREIIAGLEAGKGERLMSASREGRGAALFF